MPLLAALIEGLQPRPDMTISEWSEENVVLTMSAESGPIRIDRTPYAREMMDVIGQDDVEVVVYHTSAQVAKTTSELCGIGYHIHHDPCPMLLVLPRKEDADLFSKVRLAPFVNASPVLRDRVGLLGSRQTTSTSSLLQFPSGFLRVVGSNVAADLAALSVRIVWADEVDRFAKNAEGEGDPLDLAYVRATTFKGRSKLIASSTPTWKGSSKIDDLYEHTDKRQYHVPLPCCDTFQVLEFERIQYTPGRPDTAEYVCPHCGCCNDQYAIHRARNDPRARWIAEKPFNGWAGFHIWKLYSNFSTMEAIIADFEKAKGNLERTIRFWNTTVGRSYDGAEAHGTTAEKLLNERIKFPEWTIPRGACVMTAGVDVQTDRIEVLFVAHGPNRQSWFCKHVKLYGMTAGTLVWNQLEELLLRPWVHETHPAIKRKPEGVAIDSGNDPQRPYEFAVKAFLRSLPWFAIKGEGGPNKLAWSVSKFKLSKDIPARLNRVGVDGVKADVHARLAGVSENIGRIYIREDDCFDIEFMEQLLAEQLRVSLNPKGFAKQEWHKTRTRNEALDCAVYADAVHSHLNIDHFARLASMDKGPDVDFGALASLFN